MGIFKSTFNTISINATKSNFKDWLDMNETCYQSMTGITVIKQFTNSAYKIQLKYKGITFLTIDADNMTFQIMDGYFNDIFSKTIATFIQVLEERGFEEIF